VSALKIHRFFLATLMGFAVAIMLSACSSDEEEAPDDTGVPCDLDMMQPGCGKEDVDT
jgi:hypothetical protein